MNSETLSLKTIINVLKFLKKKVITQGNIKKDLQFFVIKLTEKISHSCNAKEHYQSVIRKKNTKSVEQ